MTDPVIRLTSRSPKGGFSEIDITSTGKNGVSYHLSVIEDSAHLKALVRCKVSISEAKQILESVGLNVTETIIYEYNPQAKYYWIVVGIKIKVPFFLWNRTPSFLGRKWTRQ